MLKSAWSWSEAQSCRMARHDMVESGYEQLKFLPKPTQHSQHCCRVPDTPQATTTGPLIP